MAARVSAATAKRFPNQLLRWIRCVQPLDGCGSRCHSATGLRFGVYVTRHCVVWRQNLGMSEEPELGFIERHVSDAFAVVEHPMAPGILGSPIHTHSREDELSYV